MKMMSKGSKEVLTVLIVTHVTQVKESKVVFVAFTQHCIQSNVTHFVTHFVTHVERVESVKYYVLYYVYRASHPSKGEGYLFESLPSCEFSYSPPVSPRRQLC